MKIVPSWLSMRSSAIAASAAILSMSAWTANAIEEVIVTAQKTEKSIQDVPIAVTAITADTLQARGINDVAKLSNFAPNVTLDGGTPFSGSDTVLAAFIRGIGQNDFAFNQDPGVGVYVDGVYLARSVGSNTNMLDVERVEILKGPQGTLFGRNTIGGAISIVTREPGDEYMFKGEITGGSYSRIDVQGTADLPVSERFLTSVSFSYKSRDGYQDRVPFPETVAGSSGIPDCDALAPGTPCPTVVDGFRTQPAAGYDTSDDEGGLDQWTVRGKAVFLATDDLKFTFTADYTEIDQSATPTTQLLINPDFPALPGGLGFAGIYNRCLNGPPYTTPAAFPPSPPNPPFSLDLICSTPRLGLTPVPTPFPALPPLQGVNTDGDPTNNRLPYDSRFIHPDIDKSYATGNSFSRLENWGIAGIIDWDINEYIHLKSITAYRDLSWTVGMDLDGSPLDILHTSFIMPQDQISQEIQLTGTAFDGTLDYVLGAFYFHEEGTLHDFVTFPGAILMVDGPNSLWTDAYAGFGHLNIHLTEDITLIAGGRYSYEYKQFEGGQTDDSAFNYKFGNCFPPDLAIPGVGTCQQIAGFPSASEPYRFYPPGVNTLKFKNFSPIVGAQYQATDDMMFYVTFSQGYKTGNWTTRLSLQNAVYNDSLFFDPEEAHTFEGGMKSRWLDGRLQVNTALFRTKYSDIQLNSQIGISPTLVNAGDAENKGLEIEAQAELGMGFTVAASLGWIDATYTRLNNVFDNNVVIDDSFSLPKTPEWKFNISPQYVMNLPIGGSLIFNMAYTYTSEMYNDLGNTELLKRDPVDMLDASVTYAFPNDTFEIVVGGTNLLDERFIVTGQNQGGVQNIYGTYNEPSMWYATLRARY